MGCGAGVGTAEQGLICIPVFPQGLSVTHVTGGVEAPCCQGLPACTPRGPRAPWPPESLCSDAVRVNSCFLRRVLETSLCAGLAGAV